MLAVLAACSFVPTSRHIPATTLQRRSPPCAAFAEADESYAEQYKHCFAACAEQSIRQPMPKPAATKQQLAAGGRHIPFSDIYCTPMRTVTSVDPGRAAYMLLAHAATAAAFLHYFSWSSLLASFGAYIVTGLGITFSFHRQLTHRSFTTPKWLEYLAAYCGTLAVQGSPIEWVSDHRYHHLHTETALDPHSSYEGFWWAHMGWVLDTEMGEARCQPRSNVADLEAQPFYCHLQDQLVWHLGLHFA